MNIQTFDAYTCRCLNVRYPFIDEYKSYAYEIIFAFNLYVYITFILAAIPSISFFPIMSVNVRAQYEILAKYLGQLGEQQRDEAGRCIFYTDFIRNEFNTCRCGHQELNKENPELHSSKNGSDDTPLVCVCKKSCPSLNLRFLEVYERCYLRKVVRFHNQLKMLSRRGKFSGRIPS